jgi:type IV fimbrial biogenesis protein FimT
LKKSTGFTLIELIITMVILAIVTMAAIPSFSNMIQNNKRAADTNLLVSSINFARTEAIKRGANVTFSTDGGLESGWCVHAGDAAGDCDNDQIRGFESSGNLTFTVKDDDDQDVDDLVFDRRGFLVPQTALTVTVIPEECVSGNPDRRIIRVSPVGRTEIDEDPCP